MITRERIRQFDPVKTTLLATIPYQLWILFVLISYMVQGMSDVSSGYADAYWGNYYTGDAEGSLMMDIAGLISSFAALVAILLATWKKQAKSMLIAIACLLASIPFTQMLATNMTGIILCLFGYINLKKYPLGLSEAQHEKYIPTAMFICYSVNAVLSIIQEIWYFGDLLMSSPEPYFETIPYGFEGEAVPDWVTWGSNSGYTEISFINQISPMLIFLLITIAAIVMIYLGLRGRGSKLYRLGAGTYLSSYVLLCIILFVAMFNLLDVATILAMPDVILSIWLFSFAGPKVVQKNSSLSHISAEIEQQ